MRNIVIALFAVLCMDCKINFDDNAEFRQREVFYIKADRKEDARERKENDEGINYIELEGNIGCLG